MLEPEEPVIDRRFATTLARGMSILRAFRVGDNGLSNAELSKRTSLPRSTISRLTFTLQKLGYLSHSRRHDVYRPGPALLALGNVALVSVSFVALAQRIMQQLAEDTGTLVVLAVREDDKLQLIKTWRPQGVASLWLEVGHRIPLVTTASGQALMAAMTDDEFANLAPLVKESLEETGFDAEGLRQESLSQLLGNGYVMSPEGLRYAETINAVSVPYRSFEFDEPVSITCGATPDALSESRMHESVGPFLRQAVSDLERATGQPSVLALRS